MLLITSSVPMAQRSPVQTQLWMHVCVRWCFNVSVSECVRTAWRRWDNVWTLSWRYTYECVCDCRMSYHRLPGIDWCDGWRWILGGLLSQHWGKHRFHPAVRELKVNAQLLKAAGCRRDIDVYWGWTGVVWLQHNKFSGVTRDGNLKNAKWQLG